MSILTNNNAVWIKYFYRKRLIIDRADYKGLCKINAILFLKEKKVN